MKIQTNFAKVSDNEYNFEDKRAYRRKKETDNVQFHYSRRC